MRPDPLRGWISGTGHPSSRPDKKKGLDRLAGRGSRETSTDWAPWHVVPADHNWVRNLAVAELLVETLERLDPQLPSADPALDGIEIV